MLWMEFWSRGFVDQGGGGKHVGNGPYGMGGVGKKWVESEANGCLAREELFSYLQLIQNNPPTLSKTKQLIDIVKKMLDEANNLHVMDFDYAIGFNALDSSLKRKKSFLSPTKKQRRRKQNSGLEIDLNVHAFEYEPFQFLYLNRRGCPRANNALPMAPEVQQSTTVASIQSQTEM